MNPSDAARTVAGMTAGSRERQAYLDGTRDAALALLAPALGCEPTDGPADHQLMGRRFRLSIEWLDGLPSDAEQAVARQMARSAQQRFASW